MTKNNENRGEEMLIVQGDDLPPLRLFGESEQAYAARLAYCRLPPAERSVTAAFRSVKGEPADSRRRAPGRYFEWSKRFDWAAAATDWDTYVVALHAAEPAGERQSAMWAKETEQSEQLQEMIDQTLAELQALARPTGRLGWLRRLLTGGRKRKLAELQLLTAAYNNLQAAPTKRFVLGAPPPQLPAPRADRE